MTKYRSYRACTSFGIDIINIWIDPPTSTFYPVCTWSACVSTSVVGSSLCSSFGYLSVLVLLLGTLFWTLGTMFFGSPPKNILIYCLCLSLLPAFGCSLVHCYLDIAHKRTCINHIETMTQFSVWHHLSLNFSDIPKYTHTLHPVSPDN